MKQRDRLPTFRRLQFQTCAFVLGCVPFFVLEIGLRSFVAADPPLVASFDQEYHRKRPLFVKDKSRKNYVIAKNRRSYFAEESFPIDQSQDVIRIFVVGGSTVQGRPYSTQTAFPNYLKEHLKIACPALKWQVVNCGGISYGSYRLLPIVREIVTYQPDLILICTGHNEFLEHVSYQFHAESTVQHVAHRFATYSKTIRLVRSCFFPLHQLPDEVDTTLDHVDGLQLYVRSTLRRSDVIESFRENIMSMLDVCRANRIPTLLIAPPINLRTCPPFKSQFTSESSKNLVQLALTDFSYAHNERSKRSKWEAVVQADRGYALGWFRLGTQYLAQRKTQEASRAFQRAVDEDICPLRMTSNLRETLRQAANRAGTIYVDLQPILTAASRHQIIGDDVLVDHVHPSFTSHHRIAQSLTTEVLKLLGHEPTVSDWQELAAIEFERHLQSLDSQYFLSGQRTLQTLRAWAQGRGDGPALRSHQTR